MPNASLRLAVAAGLSALLSSPAAANAYELYLSGGYFFGPGPIVPDSALPDGTIRNVVFDMDKLQGHAPYLPSEETLSDDTTRMNANIDAGMIQIGEGKQKSVFHLVAAGNGPNDGVEHYSFDEAGNMIWTVDMALDPGFPEGIIRVDAYPLTTGWVRIRESEQTERNIPGGYDKAGSLKTGDVLMGRVGDFDFDGKLDGIIVAAARVPMQSELLPGAPVGNKRGFTSDIPVDPLQASEMTLRGVINMRPLLDEAMDAGDQAKTLELVTEIRSRVVAAHRNYEQKFLAEEPNKRIGMREMGWRLESVSQLVFIAWAFLSDYQYPPGKTSASVRDAMTRSMDKLPPLADQMAAYRDTTGAN